MKTYKLTSAAPMVHLLAWAAHSPSSCSSTLPEVGPLRVATGTNTSPSLRPATHIHLGAVIW